MSDEWPIANLNLELLNLKLRPMTVDDLPVVMKMEQAAYATPWPETAYRQEFKNTHAYLDVVQYKQTIVGYSGMWHFWDEVHLGTIVSHPSMRGKGIGELLLRNVITRTMALGVNNISLEVRPSNQPARKLYEKYGFEEVGRRKKYYRDHEDAIIMTTPAINSETYQKIFHALGDILAQHLASFTIRHS